MPIPRIPTHLTNWSRTTHSPCFVVRARDSGDIQEALADARANGLAVIAHGAGHSYTDAALSSNGVVIDTTGMCRILAWNPEQGVMRVEPGVTIGTISDIALRDGWWPAVTPSTAAATIGGCVALNITGKNAWKCGSFGEHVLSLDVLLASGRRITIDPALDPDVFQALVGSAGLLGIFIAITLQLKRVTSGYLDVRTRIATSYDDILAIFQEEQSTDFLEAWVDGFAAGHRLGRGIVSCAAYSESGDLGSRAEQMPRLAESLAQKFAYQAGRVLRPMVNPGMRGANALAYGYKSWLAGANKRTLSLYASTYYPPVAFSGYQALLPKGVETFQAFVPRAHARAVFTEILRRSQANNFYPLWCIVKQHRPDPFLLSYQLDGFSLEVNYAFVPRTIHRLHTMLRELLALVIAAGGRMYLAKDALLTPDLYRQSIGDPVFATFLRLKLQYDPALLLQSDLFRRLFQPSNHVQESKERAMHGTYSEKRYTIN